MVDRPIFPPETGMKPYFDLPRDEGKLTDQFSCRR